jgi:hypothetical protein
MEISVDSKTGEITARFRIYKNHPTLTVKQQYERMLAVYNVTKNDKRATITEKLHNVRPPKNG